MTVRILLLATLLLAVGGCGQKGPLYLPDEGETQGTEQTG